MEGGGDIDDVVADEFIIAGGDIDSLCVFEIEFVLVSEDDDDRVGILSIVVAIRNRKSTIL